MSIYPRRRRRRHGQRNLGGRPAAAADQSSAFTPEHFDCSNTSSELRADVSAARPRRRRRRVLRCSPRRAIFLPR